MRHPSEKSIRTAGIVAAIVYVLGLLAAVHFSDRKHLADFGRAYTINKYFEL